MSVVLDILKSSVSLWLAMAPYVLLGMFIAGVLHAFLGEGFVARHLGGKGIAPIVKATLFGIPLPICSCGVIPVATSLEKEGASRSSVLSFLVATPTTGVDSILATYSLLGPLFAVFRPLAALASGITVGLLNRVFNHDDEEETEVPSKHAVPTSFRIREAFRYGFIELAEDMGKWLLIGVLLGGILTVAIPQNFLTRHLSQPALHFLIILVIAVPLYVCATGSIPIAAALIGKGFTPGAALVFLIAGPATNTVTISFVLSRLGRKALVIYLFSIVSVSICMGLLFNAVWQRLGGDIHLVMPHGQMLPWALMAASGIILFLLIARGFFPIGRNRKEKTEKMKYQLHVPDMTCRHCEMTIESSLRTVPGVGQIRIDLQTKMVGVDGEANLEDVRKAIEAAGYSIDDKQSGTPAT